MWKRSYWNAELLAIVNRTNTAEQPFARLIRFLFKEPAVMLLCGLSTSYLLCDLQGSHPLIPTTPYGVNTGFVFAMRLMR